MISKEEKKKLIKKHSEGSPVLKNSALAFLFGGLISVGGELLYMLFLSLGAEEKKAVSFVTLSVIFLASLLTAVGVFDTIARFTGAGTLVPVSGFSNAVTSEAMDSASEGLVLGVGAKIFTVAGPVIIYGLISGVVYGIIYYIYTLF